MMKNETDNQNEKKNHTSVYEYTQKYPTQFVCCKK